VDGVEPKFEGPPFGRGSCICGFIVYAPVEVQYAPSSCQREALGHSSLEVDDGASGST
jgi:hypothetical protein